MSRSQYATRSGDVELDDLDVAPAEGWDAMFLDGEWTTGETDDWIPVTDPTTREQVGRVPAATEADVDHAYEVAADAQEDWAERPPQARSAVVEEARRLLGEYEEDVADVLGVEVGGTRTKAATEHGLAERITKVSEGLAFERNGGHKESVIPGKENIIEREPVGVVGVITPWNFPLHLSMRVVAPAIALGNSVVLKPATESAVSGGLLLARLFEEAGLPDGVLNVVTGSGADAAGEYVSAHETPAVVSFTGSASVGRQVAQDAVANLAMPSLELGGNNPHVVLEDADLDAALDAGVFGTFSHQGQVCISINRHVVHEDLYDEYVDRLADRAEELTVGDPLDDDTELGPVINESQRDEMLELVEDSLDEGATLEAGGDHDDLFVEPTVLSDVTNDMPIASNEHFGPIAPVIPVSSDEEAIEVANDTEYGLSASVHSSDEGRARDVADDIESGMVHVNDQPLNDDPHVPFGGVKHSGLGRYNGEWIMDELTRTKWVSVQHESRDYTL